MRLTCRTDYVSRPALAFVCVLLLASALTYAASPRDEGDADDRAHRNALQNWIATHRESILGELTRFLSLPNVSADLDGTRCSLRTNRGALYDGGTWHAGRWGKVA